MRWFRFAILIIVVMLIQAGLLSNLKIRPDLLLILMVFFAAYGTTTEAIITSYAIGLAYDLIGNLPIGMGIISFGVTGSAIAYLQQTVSLRKLPFQAVAIFIAGLSCGVIVYFLSFLKASAGSDFLRSAVWTSLYSAVAGPFLFYPTKWLMDIPSKSRRKY
jgi:rod shape-determining protein MreD